MKSARTSSASSLLAVRDSIASRMSAGSEWCAGASSHHAPSIFWSMEVYRLGLLCWFDAEQETDDGVHEA